MERHGKSKRGFASMDPQRQREIARLGGQTTQRLGKAHTFTPEEARLAGQRSHKGARRKRAQGPRADAEERAT
jgi:uncharacterized protein